MRYIAILIAMVAVLALALLGLRAGGSTGGASTTLRGSTSVSTTSGEAGYGSAIQAAQNAVQQASHDANSAANANP